MSYENLTMLELLEIYPEHRRVSDQYFNQFQSKVRKFVAFIGNSELKPNDFDNFTIQRFINSLEGRTSQTLTSYLSAIKAVKSLSKDLINGKVVIPKDPPKPPEAFTIEEIRKMITFCKSLRGKLANGVKLKHFWRAAIGSAYCTGLRAGDLFEVKAADIPADGYLDVLQNKTTKIVTVFFPKNVRKWIARHGQEMVVPWPHSFNWFEDCFRKLLIACGIDHGTWKWLRRSAGTYANAGGNGHELLGNTAKVFETNYKDPRISKKKPPQQVAI